MIKCAELDQTFDNKLEMFKALKANEKEIISLKKASILKSSEKNQIAPNHIILKDDAIKAGIEVKEGYIYAVINTTKYFDSHHDVHFDGLWSKTLKENKGKLFYVADHSLKIADVIAWPKDVNAYVKDIDWSVLGRDYEGKTQALVYEIKESAIRNEAAKEVIKERQPVENSVRMNYVKIKFGVNSDEKEFAENKAYYDSRINEIANKEEVAENGYFWGVEEAKIVKEGSMVLAGSNDATPIIYEPQSKHSKSVEPTDVTLSEFRNLLSKSLKN